MMMRFGGANKVLGGGSGRFDGHAHVFRSDLPMIEARRYTPGYNAELPALIDLLRAHNLDGALLVQPSFLGTDNSYLLAQLTAARDHPALTMRGVVMLEPETTADEIARLSEVGVIGMRLNLIGGSACDFDFVPWDGLLRRIDAAGWHVELHCEGAFLPPLLGSVLDRCATVVVDHFGLPDPHAPLECSGILAMLAAPKGRVLVKVSAPYRVFPQLPVGQAVMRCAPILDRLVNHIGPDHLIWGSDWPWTRFEGGHSYSDLLDWTTEPAKTLTT